MTPTQEQALTFALRTWDASFAHTDTKFVDAIFMAGYALGAQERQAQDARICKELGEHGPADMSGAFSHARLAIECTPTEPA